jgi:glycosyltransferase involved in cell wall biosynthesis
LIVFAGGLREKKGVRQLVQALPKVVKDSHRAHLRIYGADTQDRATGQSFLELLKDEIEPTVRSKVEFCGAVPHRELPVINASASVLVYPSWMETQGIVVIEGMASACPVIASQTGPGPELIQDGYDGLLCDPYSPDSIAEKITLLLGNPALRSQLSANARAKAEKQFSVAVLFEKNLAFYRKCLETSQGVFA